MAKGLMKNEELVDSIIVDFNSMLKEQISGQYIGACNMVTQIIQKLLNLKKGIANDLKAKDEKIEILKEHIKNCGGDVVDDLPTNIFDGEGDNGNGTKSDA